MEIKVLYENKHYALAENETVLDCLLRSGQNIPHSCKAGSCQSCMMKMVKGEIPEIAQQDISTNFKQMGYFLSCQCRPKSDVSVQLPDSVNFDIKASIIEKKSLGGNVLKVGLRLLGDFEYRAGQYITIANDQGLVRCYSIANKTKKDRDIDLHVRLLPNGKMGGWLQDVAKIGDEVVVRGPAGDCFYLNSDNKDYPILLSGTGTGLSPLYGILLDALESGHRGEIKLYHGALKEADLYFIEELREIAEKYSNFTYIPCVLRGEEGSFYKAGNIEDIVLAELPQDKSQLKAYLCGAPDLVNSLKIKIFLAGVSTPNIHSDAFLPSKE